MNNTFRTYITTIALIMSTFALGQNATSSPSSRFGVGELDENVTNEYRAMGGTAIGMRRQSAINPAQPASYTACDSLSFMFDLAASAMWTNYGDANGQRNKANGNLEYLMLQFPIYKRYIAFAAGVMPYSSMGYDFQLSNTNFAHPYVVTYSGEGDISQAFGGLSVNICDWVALGANFYYMFGSMQNTTALRFTDASISSSLMYRTMQVSNWRGRYGIQLFHTFAEKHKVVLGGMFESRLRMNGTYMQYELNTLDSVIVTSDGFETPMIYGAGLSYAWNDRLLLAADYSCQKWSNAKYFARTGALSDRTRYSFGIEYRHNPYSRKYVEQVRWRAGFALTDYTATPSATLAADYNTRHDYTISLGVGLPLRTSQTMFNATVEYTRRQMLGIHENVLQLTINAAIDEMWFMKRKL